MSIRFRFLVASLFLRASVPVFHELPKLQIPPSPSPKKKWLFITEQNAAMVRYFDYFSLEFVVFRMNTEHVTRLYAGVNFRIHSIFKDISIRSE